MKKSKRENKARILPFTKTVKLEGDKNISEITRNLFSETWHSYLDQVSMVALKLENELHHKKEEQPITKRHKLRTI